MTNKIINQTVLTITVNQIIKVNKASKKSPQINKIDKQMK